MKIRPPFLIEQYRRTKRGTFYRLLCATTTGYQLVGCWCACKWRQATRYDLKGDLQMQERAARQDIRDFMGQWGKP